MSLQNKAAGYYSLVFVIYLALGGWCVVGAVVTQFAAAFNLPAVNRWQSAKEVAALRKRRD